MRNNTCEICGSSEVLDLEFGIDTAPFRLCDECYDKFIEAIHKGIKSIFTYIAALNPEKTSHTVEYSDEFQCDVCNNTDDYTNFHILWIDGTHYHVCEFCARQLEITITNVTQILRSARNEELKWTK